MTMVTYPKPNVGKTYKMKAPATTDEFNGKRLGLQWQWNHNPDNSRWSLTERKGYMRLKASKATNLLDARNTLTQRVQGPLSQGTVEMDVTELKDGNVAGFGILEKPYAYVAVVQKDGKRQIVMCNNGNVLKMGLGIRWTANRFALLNFSTTEEGVGGSADFNWFRFINK